ncbi:ABC transporter ATP-binding protein [Streptosporangium sandarakinum]|uniref:ABC-2 type transport system ATP-binding protein n=1 Tax=Streptosporangium sandarakinum TaxID=1260955 RepID=A0A852V539_9ACTN|nr:ABC transporter ATP-binding protein [Streptosporangium sandarakinum]NYF43206.1 ABC-2 type transport system ATP-binding protein [Streptosporangium sandarakinum]
MSTAVSVRRLRMAYGTAEVLRGVDLDIRRGEIFTLLGPNGAGKTTTIEILEGFRNRSAGEVSVLGADPARGGDAWRARLGIVLQSWRDHGRWGVRELLAHVGEFYDRPRDPDELLAALGLAEQAAQRVSRLSGGQRRRLDVGLGIMGRPELLFLDEPTTGFDPEARREFHLLVERLAADGMTVLLTTHDLAEAEKLAHRTAILVRGEIVACGSPAELADAVRAESQVRWLEDGRERVLTTADPSRAAWELHERFGGPVPGLQVRRPSLEENYLSLVGRAA